MILTGTYSAHYLHSKIAVYYHGADGVLMYVSGTRFLSMDEFLLIDGMISEGSYIRDSPMLLKLIIFDGSLCPMRRNLFRPLDAPSSGIYV